MTDEHSSDIVSPPPEMVSSNVVPPISNPPKSRGGKWVALILLIIVMSGGISVFQLWQLLQQTKQTLTDQTQVSTAQLQQLEQQLQTIKRDVEQQTQYQQRLQQVETQQQQLTTAYKTLYQRTRKSGDAEEWSIAEVNYLLQVAQQRLRLEHDIETALLALKAADERLQKAGPLFLSVREQVSKDLQALSQIKIPDISGIVLKLGLFSRQTTNLPLLQGLQGLPTKENPPSQKSENPNTNDWSDIGQRVWLELQKLVTIRYNSQLESGLLSIEQRGLISDMLRLKLENAKTLLLARQTTLFHQELKDLEDWVKHYYDQQDNQVSNLLVELKNMQTLQLIPTLPDISQSLVALQKISADLAPTPNLETQATP
ncbi:MAG: uroporphyrin-III C-methyltransferase [Pseudomonadota bacterium]|jgi:uroporphyrin-3 C-methyltransferase